MKKLLYALCLLLLVGTVLSSCATDKKCPAYTKVETQKTLKTV
ncbi:hypothetical protein EV201_1419 [Ancylomarina subtilis]|uniref:Lipoprotein n=1 Tax=Ancylomarina subtilis TaxID=1639035 RepID=A0A4Q7VKL1_9BACT|nr:hypothetical protein EV201_1419 [Ancylomarina subtilis]